MQCRSFLFFWRTFFTVCVGPPLGPAVGLAGASPGPTGPPSCLVAGPPRCATSSPGGFPPFIFSFPPRDRASRISTLLAAARPPTKLDGQAHAFETHAESCAHHPGNGRRRSGALRGRPGDARLHGGPLRLRQLYVDSGPHSPRPAREPAPAHGGSGVRGDRARLGPLPHLPVRVPLSEDDASPARFAADSRPRASIELANDRNRPSEFLTPDEGGRGLNPAVTRCS